MKMKRLLPIVVLLAFAACGKNVETPPAPTPGGGTKPTPTPGQDDVPAVEYLQFNPSGAHDITCTYNAATGVTTLVTTGTDPYIRLQPFTKALTDETCVLSFEYSTQQGLLDNLQLFFGPPEAQERSRFTGTLPSNGTNWTSVEYNLADQRKDYAWGGAGDWLRMDFGGNPGITIQLRKICFRALTEEEVAAEKAKEERMADHGHLADELKAYLTADYTSKVTQVEVTAAKVIVQGTCDGEGAFLLSEITPWMDVTRPATHKHTTSLKEAAFRVELPRYAEVDGVKYDRLLSKWAILKDGETPELVSRGRYADIVAQVSDPGPNPFPTKKGVAGVGIVNGENDIKDMGAKSVTMNMCLNDYLAPTPVYGTSEYIYANERYNIVDAQARQRDNVMYQYTREGAVPIGIVLIPQDGRNSDPMTQRLTHPECTGGYYAMPDMTTPEGVIHYAAVMDFLCSRYNSEGDRGRIGHWIMHNEIDAGTTWTNMGEKQPRLYFMDTYIKSMRLVYNIVRQYDPAAWVLASFTHNWTKVDEDYAVVPLLDDLLDYSRAEGDFQWGVAFHPYPRDLNRPAFWNDDKALTTSMDTPYVTFYNLEVYDKWARDPKHLYQGKDKRVVILSENGTNTPSYSDEDQALQAAGACWVWKKVKALDGIDAIQWHGWIDHEQEFGLRIGFRKYGTDSKDPYGKKKSWYVWQAAGTDREDEVFEPYKTVIGISDWDDIFLH